jgi:hypothetical protein
VERFAEKKMNVGNSVRKAIDDWQAGDLNAAMLHACNAIDGTAKKVHPKLGVGARFTKLLRDNYSVLSAMSAPGIDLVETRFPVNIKASTADGAPDLADLVYVVHRCSEGHGDELPSGFELLRDAAGASGFTQMQFERNKVQLSDRIIFGLVAVAVFSPANIGQYVPDSYYLTFGSQALKLPIKDWWGRAKDFPTVAATESMPQVKLDFTPWMSDVKQLPSP